MELKLVTIPVTGFLLNFSLTASREETGRRNLKERKDTAEKEMKEIEQELMKKEEVMTVLTGQNS